MLNIIKWDIILYFKKYFGIYVFYLLLILVSLLCPSKYTEIRIVGLILFSLGVVVNIIFLPILINFQLSWLNGHTAILENSIPIDGYKILLEKIIVVSLFGVVNNLLALLLYYVFKKFSINMEPILPTGLSDIIIDIFLSVIFSCIVFLASFIARIINKNKHTFLFLIILLTMSVLIGYLYIYISKIIWNTKGSYNPFTNVYVSNILFLVLIVLLFIADCKLFKSKIDL